MLRNNTGNAKHPPDSKQVMGECSIRINSEVNKGSIFTETNRTTQSFLNCPEFSLTTVLADPRDTELQEKIPKCRQSVRN